MAIQKNDFIEMDFTARVKGGEIFDTSRKEDAKKLGIKEGVKPLIISVGQEMVVPGLDKNLVGKELNKDYEVDIEPKEAFGKRDAAMVQMVPLTNFMEQKVYPERGMQFSLDGRLAKVLSVSSGRVLVDFNNALAGKNVVYNYKISRKIEDKKEQLDALQDFFFRKKFDSEINGDKIKVKVDKEFSPLFDLMKKKFEEILKATITIEVISKKEETKKA